MNVDSSGNMVVSPISVRGQERLARLRASIQHQFGGDGGGVTRTASRSLDMGQAHSSSVYGQTQSQQQPRSKIRQRIEQASRMTSDEIFFREFGSPKQLMALDFDLARTEQPRLSHRHMDFSARPSDITDSNNSSARTTTTQYSNAPPQTTFSSNTSTRVEQSRLDHSVVPSAANRSHSVHDRSQHSRSSASVTAAVQGRTSGSSSMAVVPSVSAFSAASQSNARAVERPAYVSQLQRPTRILTPKKQSLKRQRSADDPPSAEKAVIPPPAQKPRLLSDVTSTFNNRSFSNVGQARGSTTSSSSRSANPFMNSPVRKAPTFARPTMLQLPSPSKFRVPTSTTRLFGQRHGSYR